MPEAPNPWDLVLSRIDRLEEKVDRVGERVVPRDEFERYKTSQAAELASIRADAKEQAKVLEAYKTSEQDEKNKGRMWVAGMILTPIIAAVVSFLAAGVGGAS